jgi:hypothetical protein
MWNNVQREQEWERAEREALNEAVAQTDREIADSVFYNGSDENDRNSNRQIVNDLSQSEDWEGNDVSDDELIRETTGEIPAGMAGMVPTRADDALMEENAALRRHISEMQENLPEPEPVDMFADPQGFREQLIEDVTQGRLPRGLNYGQNPNPEPDMFADPQGHTAWVINEAARRSGVAEHESSRVNASMQHAHQRHGADFEQAYTDIIEAAQRDPRARAAVQGIWDSPDPGNALMHTWSAMAGSNFATQRFGGAPFAPMLRSMQRRSPHEGSARRSRGWYDDGEQDSPERAMEDSIADAAWE